MLQLTKRLLPGQDIRNEIEKFVHEQKVQAGVILSLVGCVSQLELRVSDGKTIKKWNEPFEIVSATGTLSENGCHIHISASNQDGITFGGHLREGCLVGTTIELVIVVFDMIAYERELDELTGYDEIIVRNLRYDKQD